MVKQSDFDDDLKNEFCGIHLYKKHVKFLDNVYKETKKSKSQIIRELIDSEIRKYNGKY